jgi:hypothetical protein
MMRSDCNQGRIIDKGLMLAAASWIALAGLAACATVPMSKRTSSTAAAANPPALPAATDSPSTPSPAPPPEVPQPEVPQPVASSPAAPSPQDAPPVPGTADRPASANATLPPCVPTPSKARHGHKRKPKEVPQGPEPPATGTQPLPDAVINAQVGQVGTPLTSILGKDVHGPKGEQLGRVVDVLADADGQVRVAIIDFGGFLGVGTRRIAVDWPLLRFNPNAHDKSLTLSVTREKLQSAPEYKDANSPRVLMPPSHATPDNAGTGQTTR